jgi:hypothetical protein
VPASYNNYGNTPGMPGVIGSPAQQGVVHPAGGSSANWAGQPGGFNPPPPQLGEPVPPPPPLAPQPPAFGAPSGGDTFNPQPPQYNPAFQGGR